LKNGFEMVTKLFEKSLLCEGLNPHIVVGKMNWILLKKVANYYVAKDFRRHKVLRCNVL
jgi:hypothetical protein